MAKRSTGLRFQPSGGARAATLPAQSSASASSGWPTTVAASPTRAAAPGSSPAPWPARRSRRACWRRAARSSRRASSGSSRPASCVASRPAPWPGAAAAAPAHLAQAEQVALEQRSLAEPQLHRLAALEPREWAAPLLGSEFGYRRRARLAVRYNPEAAIWLWAFAPRPVRRSSPSTPARCWYRPCSRCSPRCPACCAACSARRPSAMSSCSTALPARCWCAIPSR